MALARSLSIRGSRDRLPQALDERRLELAAILMTQHHADHLGRVDALRRRLRGPVFGPTHEAATRTSSGREEEHTMTFDVLGTPAHTAGRIAYSSRSGAGEPMVCCGDTLFPAGCGELFEGAAPQMCGSPDKMAELPDATRVCHGRAGDDGSDVLAALRTWKNEFR